MAYSSEIGPSALTRRLVEREGRSFVQLDDIEEPVPIDAELVEYTLAELEYRSAQTRKASVALGLAGLLLVYALVFRMISLAQLLPCLIIAWLLLVLGTGLYTYAPLRAAFDRVRAEYCISKGIAVPTVWSEIQRAWHIQRGRLIVPIGLLVIIGIKELFFE